MLDKFFSTWYDKRVKTAGGEVVMSAKSENTRVRDFRANNRPIDSGAAMHTNEFAGLDMDELAVAAKADRKAFTTLILRFLPLIETKARVLAVNPSDVSDLSQEGLCGLMRAVKTYNPEREASFDTYAHACIRNRMFNYLQKAARLVQNDNQIYQTAAAGSEPAQPENPETIVLAQARTDEIYQKIISSLSEKEWRVFQLFLNGLSYGQISGELNISRKETDNAMQRVRRKLKSVLKTG